MWTPRALFQLYIEIMYIVKLGVKDNALVTS